jgi:hypothetical protein
VRLPLPVISAPGNPITLEDKEVEVVLNLTRETAPLRLKGHAVEGKPNFERTGCQLSQFGAVANVLGQAGLKATVN